MAQESKGRTVLQAGAVLISKLASSSLPLIPDIASAVTETREQIRTAFEARLEDHSEAVDAISTFKIALADVRDSDLPVVICVDELDRCRPDFAIEFLEISKHIFDVDGVAFILAINLTELAHSVQVMYGNHFDGTTYLRRFVDHAVHLPKPDRTKFVDHLLDSVGLPYIKESSRFARIFFNEFVLEASHIGLRDIEQAIHHLGIALKAGDSSEYGHGVSVETLVSVLMIVRIVLPEVYSRFIGGKASDLEVVREMTRIAGRSDDWWETERSNMVTLSRRMAIWEAILIGCGRYLGGSQQPTSPLLEQRKSESTDKGNGYPNAVIDNYRDVSSTDDWRYARALALIEMWAFDSER